MPGIRLVLLCMRLEDEASASSMGLPLEGLCARQPTYAEKNKLNSNVLYTGVIPSIWLCNYKMLAEGIDLPQQNISCMTINFKEQKENDSLSSSQLTLSFYTSSLLGPLMIY